MPHGFHPAQPFAPFRQPTTMLWKCPACETAICHASEAALRPGVIYRCPVCHLELVIDERDEQLASLVVAPLRPKGPERPKTKGVTRPPDTVSTDHPPSAPPQLFCPACDQPLVYRHTVLGGVTPPERWDHFDCREHGAFEYRHRTRRLQPKII